MFDVHDFLPIHVATVTPAVYTVQQADRKLRNKKSPWGKQGLGDREES
jgi:hypothetical protein